MPEDKDKKLEYLQRGEIKTMQKDVAKLREVEANQERERVSKINTVEDAQKQIEKEDVAKKEAEQRVLEQEQAQKREEEVKRLKEERIKTEAESAKQEIENKEIKAESFKDALREVQAKEEAERKIFLQRVEAKVEGKEELPQPKPPVEQRPASEKIKPLAILKKIPMPTFKRPSLIQRLWIKIVLTLLTIAIIAAIATFWYWYLAVREKAIPLPPVEEEIVQQELIIPTALISIEASQTLDVSLLGQFLAENIDNDKFTRLILKNQEKNEVLGLKEFFEAFGVKAPLTFYNKIDNDFTLFIYSSQSGNRLGLITKVKEPYLFYLIENWEATMENDIEDLSIFLGKTGPSLIPSFRQSSYQGVDFRYLSFASKNMGLCWATTDQYFILTFSGESIIKTIDKIQ